MAQSHSAPLQDSTELTQGLTHDDDDELRRLNYFNQIGTLAGAKLDRFLELRLRDRRKTIRPPREFMEKANRAAEERIVQGFLARLRRR